VRIRGSVIDPDVSARAIWQSGDLGEKWRQFSLRNVRFFTSLPKEVVLKPLKIHRPRSGSNPRTLGPVASTLTTTPPRATIS
jgi:hypothetical protein